MFESYSINEAIMLQKNHYETKESFPVYYKEKLDSLCLQINLKGASTHRSLVCEYTGKNLQNYTNIDIINTYEGCVSTELNKEYKFLEIFIKKKYLYDLLPKHSLSEDIFNFFESSKCGKNLSNKLTTLKSKTIANDVFNIPFSGHLKKLYFESKTLELVYEQLFPLFEEKYKIKNIIKLSEQDKEAIYYAKYILSQNLQNPPSIKELSRLVSLNELKLKIGFHEFFNETPYNLSLEYRLKEAKKLLESSEYNISEISEKIGYKYIGSFSNAFYKRFGVRPKDIMKSRKYYY